MSYHTEIEIADQAAISPSHSMLTPQSNQSGADPVMQDVCQGSHKNTNV